MNKRTFLLTYNDALDRNEIKTILNRLKIIQNWLSWSKNHFFLVTPSDVTAKQLNESLKPLRSNKSALFFVCHIDDDRDGWLSRDTWKFLRQPKAVWEEDDKGEARRG